MSEVFAEKVRVVFGVSEEEKGEWRGVVIHRDGGFNLMKHLTEGPLRDPELLASTVLEGEWTDFCARARKQADNCSWFGSFDETALEFLSVEEWNKEGTELFDTRHMVTPDVDWIYVLSLKPAQLSVYRKDEEGNINLLLKTPYPLEDLSEYESLMRG